MTLSDFIPGGLTIGDAVRTARMLEEDGLIDCINVSAAGYHNVHIIIPPSDTPDGHLVELTAELKSAVSSLPVFTVGGIKDAAFAEEIVATGKADMVAMTARRSPTPSSRTRRAMAGTTRSRTASAGIRGASAVCSRGSQSTARSTRQRVAKHGLGRGTLTPSASPKAWLVVGGGPAGMKAAATLAARGHHATLLEKSDRLGGQVNLILKTPGRETFEWVTKDLEREMRRAGVDVQLGVEATADHVRSTGPDGVVVATGAVASNTGFSIVNPLVERLPGVEHENVLTVWDVLEGTKEAGERVVVLDDDGSRYASGVCEVLLDAGSRSRSSAGSTRCSPTRSTTSSWLTSTPG